MEVIELYYPTRMLKVLYNTICALIYPATPTRLIGSGLLCSIVKNDMLLKGLKITLFCFCSVSKLSELLVAHKTALIVGFLLHRVGSAPGSTYLRLAHSPEHSAVYANK